MLLAMFSSVNNYFMHTSESSKIDESRIYKNRDVSVHQKRSLETGELEPVVILKKAGYSNITIKIEDEAPIKHYVNLLKAEIERLLAIEIS